MESALDQEFKNLCVFISKEYNIAIEENKDLIDLTKASLTLLISLKIWDKHITDNDKIFFGAKYYFKEIISNINHAIILFILGLKIPCIIMLRRSQENILTFIYYSEHPIEFYKKEIDGHSKNFNGFKELKDYITSYPFDCKYLVSNQVVQKVCSEVLEIWTEQYQELSNFVHGSNTKYFEKMEFLDELLIEKEKINYLYKNIEKLSSVLNSLLIIFFYDLYEKFDDELEKSPIRRAIKNEYNFKSKITDIFKAI